MADETTIQPQVQSDSRAQERIRELSEKVELTSKERDEKDRILKETTDKVAALEKENAFNSGFADVLGWHSAAKDHKDEIRAKVLAGYSVKDATWAVLGEAGKLGGTIQAPIASPAGGSAPNQIQQDATKSVAEMTQQERREALTSDPNVLVEALRNAR